MARPRKAPPAPRKSSKPIASDGLFEQWEGRERDPYFRTQRSFWQDERLRPNAKVLMGYLLSLPPDWRMSIKNIQAEFKDTPAYMGKHYLQVAVKDLIAYNYMWRRQLVSEEGDYTRWQYLYSDSPFNPGWK